MKPLISTSVFGLIPLPHLSERTGHEWKAGTDELATKLRELGYGNLCPCAEDEPANAKYNVDRLALFAQLIFAIWRRRGEDR